MLERITLIHHGEETEVRDTDMLVVERATGRIWFERLTERLIAQPGEEDGSIQFQGPLTSRQAEIVAKLVAIGAGQDWLKISEDAIYSRFRIIDRVSMPPEEA